MQISLSDGLLLGVVALSAAAYVAPTLAAALEARKATRLARVVAAGGRLAAQIAVELRAVPAGATAADLKARLVEQAVQRLKSPELMGHTISALKGSDTGIKNIVEGELARLQLASGATAPAASTAVSPAAVDLAPVPVSDLGLPLTPSAPPSPYPPLTGTIARVAPLLLGLQLLAACALPQSRATDAFEAEAAYVAAARSGVAYRFAPGADPETVSTLRRLDREAYAAVAESRAAPGDAAKLALAQQSVRALADYLRDKGIR